MPDIILVQKKYKSISYKYLSLLDELSLFLFLGHFGAYQSLEGRKKINKLRAARQCWRNDRYVANAVVLLLADFSKMAPRCSKIASRQVAAEQKNLTERIGAAVEQRERQKVENSLGSACWRPAYAAFSRYFARIIQNQPAKWVLGIPKCLCCPLWPTSRLDTHSAYVSRAFL